MVAKAGLPPDKAESNQSTPGKNAVRAVRNVSILGCNIPQFDPEVAETSLCLATPEDVVTLFAAQAALYGFAEMVTELVRRIPDTAFT